MDLHHDIAEDVISRRQGGEKDILRRIWIPRLRRAGIAIQVFPIFIDSNFLPEMALRRELTMIEYLLEEIEQNADRIVLATNYRQLETSLRENKIVALLALEGAEAIDPDLAILEILYRLGVRLASLTWNRRTMFADGAGEPYTGAKLTSKGIALVQKMEERRILIDVSHLSESSFWSLFEVTQKPIVASHSSVRALCDHPRNLTDEQIRAVAQRNGVIGIMLHPSVIDPANPSIARVVDHIEHIATLVGTDHIGIGCDFISDLVGLEHTPTAEWLVSRKDAFAIIPRLAMTEDLPHLVDELIRRGFNQQDVRRILSDNCLRVFRHIWG